jgi:hypothetical protein
MTVVAATSKLASSAQLKAELNLAPGNFSQDVHIDNAIMAASSTIETYLDRTLGTAAFTQTKNYMVAKQIPDRIFLVKYPVSALTEFAFTWSDGVTTDTLDADEYFFEADEGIITLTGPGKQLIKDALYAAQSSASGAGYITLSINHTGGYDLPEEVDTAVMDLPEVISRACLDLASNTYYTRNQNPTVKSEAVPDVLSQTFFQPRGGSTGGGDGYVGGVLNSLDSYLDLRQVF